MCAFLNFAALTSELLYFSVVLY